MAQQTSSFEPTRKTSKALSWEQEEALKEYKGRAKRQAKANKQAITVAMQARGLRYRDR